MAPSQRDVITIENLVLPHPIAGPDAWSFTRSTLASKVPPTVKSQSATVSLRLLLRPESFVNAARDDTVNPEHTVHYGELSKAIRTKNHEGQTLHEVFVMLALIVADLPAVEEAMLDIHLPKGSMFGSKVQVAQRLERLDQGPMKGSLAVKSGRLLVAGLPMACLIGVNANERTGKQPLIVEYDVDYEGTGIIGGEDTGVGVAGVPGNRTARLLAAFSIESYLFEVSPRRMLLKGVAVLAHSTCRFADEREQIIEKTSFETLESLIEFAYSELRRQLLDENLPGASFRLQIAKPRAIIFADAPSVEIHRTVPLNELQRFSQYHSKAA
jgi:dihydroneopterin aldolase